MGLHPITVYNLLIQTVRTISPILSIPWDPTVVVTGLEALLNRRSFASNLIGCYPILGYLFILGRITTSIDVLDRIYACVQKRTQEAAQLVMLP